MPKTTSIRRGDTSIKGSRLPILFLLIIISTSLSAQDKDAWLWSGLELEKDINKWLQANAAFEARFDNNISQAERYLAEIGLTSDLGKYIDASLYYRYYYRYFPEYNWASYNRFYADLRFKYDYMAFSFYERARIVLDEVPPFLEEGYIESTARFKTQATYNIRKTPLRARGSVEFFLPVTRTMNPMPEKVRYKLGMVYKINRSVSVELGYMFQKRTVKKKPQINYIWAVTLGYSF